MTLQIVTFRERPDLVASVWTEEFSSNWPTFIVEGSVLGDLYYDSFFLSAEQRPFLDFGLVAFDPLEPERPLARAFSVPFEYGTATRTALPESGWDTVVRWADWDQKASRPVNAVSAVEVNVHPDAQGRGLSGRLLEAMRENARRMGFKDLYAPVRPSAKHLEPHTPMSEYAFRQREDALPFDPWLRVHARAGATIVGVAATSMTVSGPLKLWREWTGLPFDVGGEVCVPGGLVPVLVSLEHGVATYTEPNVWMHHRLVES